MSRGTAYQYPFAFTLRKEVTFGAFLCQGVNTPLLHFLRGFAAGPERLVYPVEANELFVRMTADEAARIRAQGFDFYDWAPGEVRLVTSWDQDLAAVGKLADAIRAL